MRSFLPFIALGGLVAGSAAWAQVQPFVSTEQARLLRPAEQAVFASLQPSWLRQGAYLGLLPRVGYERALTAKLQLGGFVGAAAERARYGAPLDVSGVAGARARWAWVDTETFSATGRATAQVGRRALGVEAAVLAQLQGLRWVLATQLTAERDWRFSASGTQGRWRFQQSLAAGWKVTPQLTLGLEVNHRLSSSAGGLSALYLGPSVSRRGPAFWWTLGFAPQVASLGRRATTENPNIPLELTENERFMGFVQVGWAFR